LTARSAVAGVGREIRTRAGARRRRSRGTNGHARVRPSVIGAEHGGIRIREGRAVAVAASASVQAVERLAAPIARDLRRCAARAVRARVRRRRPVWGSPVDRRVLRNVGPDHAIRASRRARFFGAAFARASFLRASFLRANVDRSVRGGVRIPRGIGRHVCQAAQPEQELAARKSDGRSDAGREDDRASPRWPALDQHRRWSAISSPPAIIDGATFSPRFANARRPPRIPVGHVRRVISSSATARVKPARSGDTPRVTRARWAIVQCPVPGDPAVTPDRRNRMRGLGPHHSSGYFNAGYQVAPRPPGVKSSTFQSGHIMSMCRASILSSPRFEA
jgi:hypothetical protein